MCLLNLMTWKAGCAHRTGENEKKDNDKKKSVQTSSACGLAGLFAVYRGAVTGRVAEKVLVV